jgi:exodeoxyribonuclease VII small subunit
MDDLFAGGDETVADSPLPEKTSRPAPAVAATPAAAPPAKSSSPLKQEAGQSAVRFEEAFARLESLVGEMERGELPLEQMLERFEEGVRLVRHCNEFLGQAQLRVERYVEQKDGHWVLKEEKA